MWPYCSVAQERRIRGWSLDGHVCGSRRLGEQRQAECACRHLEEPPAGRLLLDRLW
jgi:hypothetical protein